MENQDTYWKHIEWEIFDDSIELVEPWRDKHFFNTFDFSVNGLDSVKIYRDEEYMLKAEATGKYIQTDCEEPETGSIIRRSVLEGGWNHYYRAKMIGCLVRGMTRHYHLTRDDLTADIVCDLQLDKMKIKMNKSIPRQKKVSLVEWCINAPASTVLYTDTTERKAKSRLVKERDLYKDSFTPFVNEELARDTVYISFEGTGCYISEVSSRYEPQWAGKLSIEYRKDFGFIPDKSTRTAVRELVGFIMGRDLKLIGNTAYGEDAQIIRVMAQNPQSVNIRKVCQLCNQEIIPVHIYGDECDNFKNSMEKMLPIYLHSRMRENISKTLPLYWSSFLLYVDNAIPIIASAIEALQKAWFSLDENESTTVYYPKAEFRGVKKQLIDLLDKQLGESKYKSVVKNKVDQLNQMSVRDRNEQFFQQLGIEYGAREVKAIRMRNAFAHGTGNQVNQDVEMIDALKVLQILYAKSVLKMLCYEGEYIDWTEVGHPRKVL